MISHWKFILPAMVFSKFAWWRASAIAVVGDCCGLMYFERAIENKIMNHGYRLVLGTTELLTVQLICFLVSYGRIYIYSHPGFGFCGMVLARQQHVCCLFLRLNSFSSVMHEHGIHFMFLIENFLTWFHLFWPTSWILLNIIPLTLMDYESGSRNNNLLNILLETSIWCVCTCYI